MVLVSFFKLKRNEMPFLDLHNDHINCLVHAHHDSKSKHIDFQRAGLRIPADREQPMSPELNQDLNVVDFLGCLKVQAGIGSDLVSATTREFWKVAFKCEGVKMPTFKRNNNESMEGGAKDANDFDTLDKRSRTSDSRLDMNLMNTLIHSLINSRSTPVTSSAPQLPPPQLPHPSSTNATIPKPVNTHESWLFFSLTNEFTG